MKPSKKSEIEFCKVCRLHHDQGPRHKYFPRHKDSLSAFLDRFRSKIADVRFFVRNPSVLRPQEESKNRVWCVFCDEDIVELGSSFAWYGIPFSFCLWIRVCLFDLKSLSCVYSVYVTWMEWGIGMRQRIVVENWGCISWQERNRCVFVIIVIWLHIMFCLYTFYQF